MNVSAIVSVYKAGDMLLPKLRNLAAQTLTGCNRLEVVIIICSSPGHPDYDVLNAWIDDHSPDHWKVWSSAYRIPIYEAWNWGIEKASSDLIVNSNVDDLCRPNAYELMAQTMLRDGGYDVVYGCWQCVTNFPANSVDKTPWLQQGDFYPMGTSPYGYLPADGKRLADYCHWSCGVMWRKTLHEKIGLFDPSFSICGDYDMWCRMMLAGARAYALPYTLGYWYFDPSGSNASFANAEQFNFENRRVHVAHDERLRGMR